MILRRRTAARAFGSDRGDSHLPRVAYRLAQRVDNFSLRLLDLGTVSGAWFLGYVAGTEGQTLHTTGRALWFIALAVAIQYGVLRAAGLYGPVWRYASVEEALRVILAVAGGAILATVALAGVAGLTDTNLPMITMPAVAALLTLLGCGGVRFQSRLFALERRQEQGAARRERALIVGAGDAGASLAFELSHTGSRSDVWVVGFVDDDPAMLGRSVRGLPVLGSSTELDRLTRVHGIDRLLISLSDVGSDESKVIINRALGTNAQVKVLPSASDRVRGPLLRSLRDLDVTDLLGRKHAPVDSLEIAHYLEGATVLITGAGGSIGSEIARQVARYKPGRLLLVDRDESLLHDTAVGPLAGAEIVLLDLRDRGRLRELFHRHRPDVVFHAAAHKHVPILERHPVEAVRTNVLGTWWLVQAAAEFGCGRFVHISTDKAADPCSVMGATKRAAEHLVFEVGRRYDLPFVAVRFGNVLGSRGSVVPTFLRQILDGGPVTVTSPDMTRYFMTIPEAVSLVLQSGAMATEGKIFLLDMGEPVPIVGLARQMIRLAGLRPDDDIEIVFTGPRQGERLHERLHDDAEVIEPSVHPAIFSLAPKVTWDWEELMSFIDEMEDRCADAVDRSIAVLLEAMLRRGGVDCHLQVVETAGGSGAEGRRAAIPSTPPMIERGSDEPGGGDLLDLVSLEQEARPASSQIDLVRRRRPAVLAGSPTFVPSLPFARPARPPLERFIERLRPSYERGMLTNGALVSELEERVADRLGVAHVVAMSSCTSGLMLAMQALTDGRPGPVVLPSFTFSASGHAVVWSGRTPRFVDHDPETFQVDCDRLAEAADGASAIFATHVFGAPCNPVTVEKVARSADIPVLFDAAHAFGATCDGRPIGGFGDAEVFSLTPTKLLVAGEGGLVATDDDYLAERLRSGRDYGNPGDYDTRFVGLNARMSEFHAAMALESLELLPASLAKRRQHAARYRRGLRDVPGIRCQVVPLADASTYKDFTVAVDANTFGLTRDQLVDVLAAEGIETRNYFDPPVHRQQAYAAYESPGLPFTETTSRSVVSLPIYPDLADDAVDSVVEAIGAAHEHAGPIDAELRRNPVDRRRSSHNRVGARDRT